MESLARISNLIEHARDLTLEAAQSASAVGRRKDALNKGASAKETKKFLNSRMEREILEGLRRVTAMMARGTDCSEFFADVVKNVASPNVEIKKLVYIYLLQYAESEPDLALLSINTIQKALNDQNQLVRALAIRVMSGIRVPVISQIVVLGIKKCASDMSAYVRKAAALAIPKCYRLDPATIPELRSYLDQLLGDKSYFVVGAAVMAFQEMCPNDTELLHRRYRDLVRMLIDMDEWGQLATLRILTDYARKCLPPKRNKVKKTRAVETKGQQQQEKKKVLTEQEFYSEDEEVKEVEGTKKEEEVKEDEWEYVQVLDPDLELLLQACPPLLQSRNSAVIMAVVRAYKHLAKPSQLQLIAGPLIGLLRGSVDIQHIALINIVSIALSEPAIFSIYTTSFLLHPNDPTHIWKLKLEMLTLLFPHVNPRMKSLILSELEFHAQDGSKELVKECVRAIGRCAQTEPTNSNRCLRLLLRQIESPDGTLVAESLTVIRHIIQQNPDSHTTTVIKLAKALDKTTNTNARASIIWLVGEFSGINGGNNIAADTLRQLAKTFQTEDEPAKLQIVLLAAKVYTHFKTFNASLSARLNHSTSPSSGSEDESDDEQETHPIPLLFNYILLLARYDTSYDLRDRTRTYKQLLTSLRGGLQISQLLLLAPKPTPHAPSPSHQTSTFTIGSAAIVLASEGDPDAERIRGYEPLPEWVEEHEAPPREVRDGVVEEKIIPVAGSSARTVHGEYFVAGVTTTAATAAVASGTAAAAVKGVGLDQWLESGSEEESSEEESSEEETDDDEEGEEDEEEESDDDEEGSEEEEEEEGGPADGGLRRVLPLEMSDDEEDETKRMLESSPWN